MIRGPRRSHFTSHVCEERAVRLFRLDHSPEYLWQDDHPSREQRGARGVKRDSERNVKSPSHSDIIR